MDDACRTPPLPLRKGRAGPRLLPHVPGAPALAVQDLTVCYRGTPALQSVDLELAPGDHLGVLGPNGAGKSTLLKAVAGVLRPSSGQIRVYGGGPQRHVCIAYLPQRTSVDWTFPLTVADVVRMGRIGRTGPLRRISAVDRARVREGLEQVGMEGLSGRQINELSGGQQQRMFIARALAQEAELLLMDEPLAGLDAHTQSELLALVQRLDKAVTLIVALHELAIARDHFPQVLLLNQSVVGLGSPEQVFTAQLLKEAYGRELHLVHTERGTLVITDTCRPRDRGLQ